MQNCSYVKCEHELLFLLGTLLLIRTLLLNGHFDALFGANRWPRTLARGCAKIAHTAQTARIFKAHVAGGSKACKSPSQPPLFLRWEGKGYAISLPGARLELKA
jgi:hypothetical protein